MAPGAQSKRMPGTFHKLCRTASGAMRGGRPLELEAYPPAYLRCFVQVQSESDLTNG